MDRMTRLRRIWDTIEEIPKGRVASYGQIAEIAGIPRGARQVAYALRVAPNDRELPWFRVIQASGKIAFEKGSSSFNRQKNHLLEEDVPVVAGRIDMQRYRWQPDLDELLWKPSDIWDEE
ncbi:MAG: MGMT family protein [Pseudomonadota bacterium]